MLGMYPCTTHDYGKLMAEISLSDPFWMPTFGVLVLTTFKYPVIGWDFWRSKKTFLVGGVNHLKNIRQIGSFPQDGSNGGFLKWWCPTTMGFPIILGCFGVPPFEETPKYGWKYHIFGTTTQLLSFRMAPEKSLRPMSLRVMSGS